MLTSRTAWHRPHPTVVAFRPAPMPRSTTMRLVRIERVKGAQIIRRTASYTGCPADARSRASCHLLNVNSIMRSMRGGGDREAGGPEASFGWARAEPCQCFRRLLSGKPPLTALTEARVPTGPPRPSFRLTRACLRATPSSRPACARAAASSPTRMRSCSGPSVATFISEKDNPPHSGQAGAVDGIPQARQRRNELEFFVVPLTAILPAK
jgi:hypothetical protein